MSSMQSETVDWSPRRGDSVVTNGFMTHLRSQWRPLSSRRGDGGGEGGGEAHLSNVECRLSPRKAGRIIMILEREKKILEKRTPELKIGDAC